MDEDNALQNLRTTCATSWSSSLLFPQPFMFGSAPKLPDVHALVSSVERAADEERRPLLSSTLCPKGRYMRVRSHALPQHFLPSPPFQTLALTPVDHGTPPLSPARHPSGEVLDLRIHVLRHGHMFICRERHRRLQEREGARAHPPTFLVPSSPSLTSVGALYCHRIRHLRIVHVCC